MEFYTSLWNKMNDIIKGNDLDEDSILISTAELTPEEAIGTTLRKDYPLLNGKEVLVEANFKGSLGQAYTDTPTVFSGSIKDVMNLDLSDNRNKVLFIATLNSILKYLGLIGNTVHCKNEEPENCAKELTKYIKDKYGRVKIGLVGLQPAMLDNLRNDFSIRVLDLDSKNIGNKRYDILIENGMEAMDEVIDWADLLLVTGSTVTNGSIVDYLKIKKPVLFYGTTIAGTAYLENLNQVCFYSK